MKYNFDLLKHPEPLPSVTAVIVAAGRGERMKSEIGKQFLPLCDIPAIAHTLSAFEICRSVSKVIVVTRAADIITVADIVREFGFSKVIRIVSGGDTRQKSAAAGADAAENAEYLAVHDGARPLVTPECIDRVVAAAILNGAAAAGIRVKDTLKHCDAEDMIESTADRSGLWMVQTPQVFKTELYLGAMKKAVESGKYYTDDCQLIENAGGRVKMVEGESYNIKLTTPDDLFLAEAILHARGSLL